MKTRAEIESEIRNLLFFYEQNVGEGMMIRNFYAHQILTLFYVLNYVVSSDIEQTVNRLPCFPFKFRSM